MIAEAKWTDSKPRKSAKQCPVCWMDGFHATACNYRPARFNENGFLVVDLLDPARAGEDLRRLLAGLTTGR